MNRFIHCFALCACLTAALSLLLLWGALFLLWQFPQLSYQIFKWLLLLVCLIATLGLTLPLLRLLFPTKNQPPQ